MLFSHFFVFDITLERITSINSSNSISPFLFLSAYSINSSIVNPYNETTSYDNISSSSFFSMDPFLFFF